MAVSNNKDLPSEFVRFDFKAPPGTRTRELLGQGLDPVIERQKIAQNEAAALLAEQRSPLEELLRLLQRSQSEALALQRSAFAELQAARAQVETDKKAAETERKGLEQKAKDKVLKRLRRNLALVETGPQGVLETASVGRTKILGN